MHVALMLAAKGGSGVGLGNLFASLVIWFLHAIFIQLGFEVGRAIAHVLGVKGLIILAVVVIGAFLFMRWNGTQRRSRR